MKKLRKIGALFALTALAVVIGVTGCKNTASAKKRGNFKITKLEINKQNINLQSPQKVTITEPSFRIDADAKISSVDVKGNGIKAKNYLGTGNFVSASFEGLEKAGDCSVLFTVHSPDKNDQEIAVEFTFEPLDIAFSEIFIGSGTTKDSADLSITDGSCVLDSMTANTKLSVVTEETLTSLTVNGKPAKNEGKIWGYDITGLTETPTTFTVTAKAAMKKDATYTFKAKKLPAGQLLKVALGSISINGNTIPVNKALSSEGYTFEFKKEEGDAGIEGVASIVVQAREGESITLGSKTATEGFVKGSTVTTSNKVSVKAVCFRNSKKEGEGEQISLSSVAVPNTVSLVVKAAGKADTTIKIILKDERTTIPAANATGVFSTATSTGYSGWIAHLVNDKAEALKNYGLPAYVIFQSNQFAFSIFSKEGDEWVISQSKEMKGNDGTFYDCTAHVGTLDGLNAVKQFYCILSTSDAAAVKFPIKVIAEQELGFHLTFFDNKKSTTQGMPDDFRMLTKLTSEEISKALSQTGLEKDLTASKFENAGLLEFGLDNIGAKVSEPSFKRFTKASSGSSWVEDTKYADNECKFLVKKGFQLFEPSISVLKGKSKLLPLPPIGYKAGDSYKYELEFKLNGSTDKKKITIILNAK